MAAPTASRATRDRVPRVASRPTRKRRLRRPFWLRIGRGFYRRPANLSNTGGRWGGRRTGVQPPGGFGPHFAQWRVRGEDRNQAKRKSVEAGKSRVVRGKR